MSPDEVMLRNARSSKDITPVQGAMMKPLTPGKQAAFGRQPSMFRLPNPRPFVKLGPGRRLPNPRPFVKLGPGAASAESR